MSDINVPKAVYSTSFAERLSPKYAHIQTSTIMENFQDLGWQVRAAQSVKSSKHPEHARHILRLRHKDYLDATVDQTIPELVILNSHNGSWALRMALGMFRVVCANGMVAGDIWEGVRIRHAHLDNLDEKIQQVTGQMGELAGKLTGTIRQWEQLDVPLDLQLDLATQARSIRWGDKSPVDPSILLEARREADQGTSLWKVFNRIQENLTQGGYQGNTTSGRGFSVKRISNVKRDFNYNSQLFSAAANMATQLEAA